jgi:acetyl esterase/lipase
MSQSRQTGTRFWWFLALFLLPLTLERAVQAAELSPEELFRAPVVYTVPGMDSVRVRRDITYETVDGKPLQVDLYTPPTGGPFPVVVFVHGGFPEGLAISPKSAGQYTSWGRLIAASGLAAVTFNHRLRMSAEGAVHLQEAATDLQALFSWIRAHAGEYSLDSSRSAVFAVSAGGPLLNVPLTEPGLRCLVAYYAFLDVKGLRWFATAVAQTPSRSWSLVDQLGQTRPLPPIFIARAGHDRVPQMKEMIDRFVARALATDADFTLANHPTGQHAFDLQDDDANSRQIVASTLVFLRNHLSAGIKN